MSRYSTYEFSAADELMTPSYEALPANFSLWDNMMAGAFAGIAVHSSTDLRLNNRLMLGQEHSVMYPIDLLKVNRPVRPYASYKA